MTSLRKAINLIPTAIVVTIALSHVACAEKEAGNTQTKKAVPPVATVTSDKIAQWQKEAKAGDADAQYNLAYIYEKGLGVPKNETKALELYQQAIDHGHSGTQNNIGSMNSKK